MLTLLLSAITAMVLLGMHREGTDKNYHRVSVILLQWAGSETVQDFFAAAAGVHLVFPYVFDIVISGSGGNIINAANGLGLCFP